ncbi:MAG: hypothetical protein MSC30_18390, partial [Gaiellaceae bacterium MAG52_C11]|nr:hypothetical protein [Candidatus Gaiellasilicea maunaloa]
DEAGGTAVKFHELRDNLQVDDAELTDRAPVATGTSQDIFVLVWPRLAAYLLDERSEREVAESFEIELSQTRAWLKRAVAEGLAQRLTSKRRYVVSGQQRSLFAADR